MRYIPVQTRLSQKLDTTYVKSCKLGLQSGDEENGSSRQQGAPLQPQKSGIASSLRAADPKDAWEGSDQSPANSTDHQSLLDRSAHDQEALHDQSAVLHQAEMLDNGKIEDPGEDHQGLAE